MKRAEILEQARKCVCGEREREYGRPENNFALIGKLWEAYTGMRYSAKDVAMMLALLKVARIKTGVKGDSFVDLAGYAACAGEIATETPKVPPVNTCISCGAAAGRKGEPDLNDIAVQFRHVSMAFPGWNCS